MIDKNKKYIVATYRYKKYLYLVIYKMGSWEKTKEYKFYGRVELYNSYFSEDYSSFFANYDVFKQYFTEIGLTTEKVDSLNCSETPKGCDYIETSYNKTSIYSRDKIYFVKRDNNHRNDILVYMDRIEYVNLQREDKE